MLSRRNIMQIGGLLAAGRAFGMARAEAIPVEIVMMGNAEGSRVWFDPIGVLIRPGGTLRWTNRDPGNAHSSTAYHPSNDGHPLRMPPRAAAWNSDYLLPQQTFSLTLEVEGVYDYYCIPHEHSGMVGRIVVLAEGSATPEADPGQPISELERDPFPSVDAILRAGHVSRL